MEKRTIGSLSVSVVGLGCNNFGRVNDEAATKDVVDAALDAGVNLLDTADIYGDTKSEEFLGRVLTGRRDRIVLATKFGMKVAEGKEGAAPAYIAEAAEASLKRLNTDYIDLYQLHRPDPSVPIGDTLEALDKLVKAGKVREIGSSNFNAEQIREAEAAAKSLGIARFVSVQNHYSLLHREPEPEVVAECARTGQAILPYFPLASGLLSGKYRKDRPAPTGTRLDRSGRYSELQEEGKLDIVEDLIAFAESKGHTILELAFCWLLAKPVVASVIAGATKPEQIQSNAAAANWEMTPEDLAEIDRIVAPRVAV
jgi:aryl-alcohol dehydrogenase-like predicted oxidoreductase